ncbi:hypothetical protein B0H14DRAFT_3742375 [Mycena olivaceomarginata]|nr:hypothetical protein B0H14DRAFT_3742375 [Mycena olivaceomarginata]
MSLVPGRLILPGGYFGPLICLTSSMLAVRFPPLQSGEHILSTPTISREDSLSEALQPQESHSHFIVMPLVSSTDDRNEVLDDAVLEAVRTTLHQSIGVLVEKDRLEPQGEQYIVKKDIATLARYLVGDFPGRQVADDVKFQGQPMLGTGTAFVVGDNIMATTGHCFDKEGTENFDPNRAKNFYVVFGFEVANGVVPESFPRTHVYEIERLLVVRNTDPDYSFFRTDRPLPPDYFPALKFLPPPGTNDPDISTPTHDARFITAGFPTGLPMKAVTGTIARYEANAPLRRFLTRASVFKGCSGSPLFGLLEGGAVSSFVVGMVRGGDTHDYGLQRPALKVAPNVMRDTYTNATRVEGIRWAISRDAVVEMTTTFGQSQTATVRASFITETGQEHQLAEIIIRDTSTQRSIITEEWSAIGILPIELTSIHFKVVSGPPTIKLESVKLRIKNPSVDFPEEGIERQWKGIALGPHKELQPMDLNIEYGEIKFDDYDATDPSQWRQ